MSHPRSDRVIVAHSNSRHDCLDWSLVLQSAGIPADVIRGDNEWLVLVYESHSEQARSELETYCRDNPVDESDEVETPIPLYAGSGYGVVGYAFILIAIAMLSGLPSDGSPWVAIGEMRAGNVMAGQAWRCMTALTLHSDAGHLLSNLVFGGIFGWLAGRILGGGFAWLTILLAGTLGNAINAGIRNADHASIGASTSVFAALGIMVAHALVPRGTKHEHWMKRWAPLIGGLVLFSMTGMGDERTDVAAHVAGMLAGFAIGWIGCRITEQRLASPFFQLTCGVATLLLVFVAWTIAIVSV